MRYVLAIGLLAACAALAPRAEAAALTRNQAIAKVQHETGGRVLSAETKQIGHQVIYRIKVLTRDGKVRIVEVPADDRGNAAGGNGHAHERAPTTL